MNTASLKKYISDGKLDETLKKLYGEKAVSAQRERYIGAVDGFINNYGDSDDVRLFSVPGRTEVSGNHTDHNYGKVLAASIDLDIIAVAAISGDGFIRVKSKGFDEDVVDLSDIKVDPAKYFTSYAVIEGMCDGFVKNGYKIGAFKAYTTSNVFKGSGLSSSAAFEDMIGNIMRTLFENDISDVEIAKISQYSENVFFGKPCGLMDQMACAVGGFIAIDFKDPKDPIVSKPEFDLSALGYSLCIVDTGGNHADLNEDYASVPAEMKSVAALLGKEVLRDVTKEELNANIPEIREKVGDRALLRAIHYLNENDRVDRIKEALEKGDVNGVFDGINASGNSSFKFLQNVYTTKNIKEQGLSLALALTEDFLAGIEEPTASRVHGGGFAGTIQVFLPEKYSEALREKLDAVFGQGATHILRIRSYGAICTL